MRRDFTKKNNVVLVILLNSFYNYTFKNYCFSAVYIYIQIFFFFLTIRPRGLVFTDCHVTVFIFQKDAIKYALFICAGL